MSERGGKDKRSVKDYDPDKNRNRRAGDAYAKVRAKRRLAKHRKPDCNGEAMDQGDDEEAAAGAIEDAVKRFCLAHFLDGHAGTAEWVVSFDCLCAIFKHRDDNAIVRASISIFNMVNAETMYETVVRVMNRILRLIDPAVPQAFAQAAIDLLVNMTSIDDPDCANLFAGILVEKASFLTAALPHFFVAMPPDTHGDLLTIAVNIVYAGNLFRIEAISAVCKDQLHVFRTSLRDVVPLFIIALYHELSNPPQTVDMLNKIWDPLLELASSSDGPFIPATAAVAVVAKVMCCEAPKFFVAQIAYSDSPTVAFLNRMVALIKLTAAPDLYRRDAQRIFVALGRMDVKADALDRILVSQAVLFSMHAALATGPAPMQLESAVFFGNLACDGHVRELATANVPDTLINLMTNPRSNMSVLSNVIFAVSAVLSAIATTGYGSFAGVTDMLFIRKDVIRAGLAVLCRGDITIVVKSDVLQLFVVALRYDKDYSVISKLKDSGVVENIYYEECNATVQKYADQIIRTIDQKDGDAQSMDFGE